MYKPRAARYKIGMKRIEQVEVDVYKSGQVKIQKHIKATIWILASPFLML